MSEQYLAELERSLRDSASDEDLARWWTLVELITSDLVYDERTSNRERSLVAELRTNVAELITAIREETANPPTGRARLSASALWLSVVTRTTRSKGLAGATWPLGRK
jgi:hypothetical protein